MTSTDLTTTESTPAPTGARYATLRAAWLPLLALCLAFFVEMVDNTVLTIALPTMGRDLGASTTQLQWVTGAYSLVFGSLLLTAGTFADRYGRRRVLLGGLTMFGLVSALVWLVQDADQLIALAAAYHHLRGEHRLALPELRRPGAPAHQHRHRLGIEHIQHRGDAAASPVHRGGHPGEHQRFAPVTVRQRARDEQRRSESEHVDAEQ